MLPTSGLRLSHSLPVLRRSMTTLASPSSTQASVFLVTTPNNEVSRTIAGDLLTKKLAACVNIVPKLTSLYLWDGRIQEDSEELLIIKSRAELSAELEARVTALHPYEVAEFIRLPIASGAQSYLDWIDQSTSLAQSEPRSTDVVDKQE